jgi:hypothetical protein
MLTPNRYSYRYSRAGETMGFWNSRGKLCEADPFSSVGLGLKSRERNLESDGEKCGVFLE